MKPYIDSAGMIHADTKEEAELLLKELSHKWYYKYLVIR